MGPSALGLARGERATWPVMSRDRRDASDPNALGVLGRADCLQLLSSVAVGRIGLSSDALPVILPVNFAVDGEQVLVRTSRGTKLDAATRNAVVAFEADDIDVDGRSGWTVTVTGVAREVPAQEIAALDLSQLHRWAPKEDERVIAISLDVMTGRRLADDQDLTSQFGW